MRGNRMGPADQGPKTGRGLGFCCGSGQPGFMADAEPMGMRRGRGSGNFRAYRGRGFGGRRFTGRGFNGMPMPQDEADDLLSRLEKLEEAVRKLSGERED